MKPTKKVSTCLMAVGLTTLAAAITASAATTVLPSKFVLRPVTPGDVSIYKLPSSTEVSGGLNTVGVGTAVYLEAEVPNTTNIVTVTWTATNSLGSPVTLSDSPLGSNVPVYEPSDRSRYQVAARKLLRPDLEGQYTVVATIATNGVTQTSLTQKITASVYVGADMCALCHSGSTSVPEKYQYWQATAHANIFTEGINGQLEGGTYRATCIKCHSVGYDDNTNAVNGGFDDVARQSGWTLPAVLSPTNWAYMQTAYPTVAAVANIQCENCHGPGNKHATSYGNTNFITKTVNVGDCNQCHDAPSHHIYGTQWLTSRHALTTGPSSPNCVGCHSAKGFIARMNGETFTNQTMAAISCQSCHEPHGETTPAGNPHLIRALGAVTMPDGTVVTNAGNGAICLQCHQNRNGSATNQLVNYPIGKPTWYGGSAFGAHDNPQGDMIEGINAMTYGQTIPSSAHRDSVPDLCVGCHMQPSGATIGTTTNANPAYLQAGGHTWDMTYNVTNNGVVTGMDMVDACVKCHGQIDSFDMVKADYNGDGVIEGVQTEVQHLLDKLSTMLPNSTYQANSNNYVADGIVKTSVSFKTNWPSKFLKAGYNWQFVTRDGSLGVHNAPFAVGLLKASIADLSGDANNDGLPDWWQIQYFGSITNPQAAPNAAPAGDGVPNWLKYNSGLDPWVPGVPMTGGYVFGPSLVNPLGTNAVSIYTAAEISFNTQVGTNYQIQSIGALGEEWQNVGGSIAGTGGSINYVTQTREPSQKFFRVVHTP